MIQSPDLFFWWEKNAAFDWWFWKRGRNRVQQWKVVVGPIPKQFSFFSIIWIYLRCLKQLKTCSPTWWTMVITMVRSVENHPVTKSRIRKNGSYLPKDWGESNIMLFEETKNQKPLLHNHIENPKHAVWTTQSQLIQFASLCIPHIWSRSPTSFGLGSYFFTILKWSPAELPG